MSLFERAMTLPAGEREGFLWSACAGDAHLREEVSGLVVSEVRMGSFLQDPLGSFWEGDRPLTPGQLLAGQFEIVRQVGEGGMAWVYEAVDRVSGRHLAIKCPKPIFSGRLLPETETSLTVTHDNVCRVHAIHRAATGGGEVEFLTMEFIEGETLRDRMDREKRLSVGDVREIARQLCAGLGEAHRKGIVHGDLKPNNVMLTKNTSGELRVVVTDFGLAGPVPGIKPSATGNALRGAPDYVAPELFRGVAKSPSSDLFALGAILFEAFSGKRPWDETSANGPVEARLPAKLPPEVPSRWKNAVGRCLQPDPSSRPSSAGALADELEGKWSKSRIGIVTAAALVVCILAGWLIGRTLFPPAPLSAMRLAILPFESDRASKALVEGVEREVADRLARVQRDGKGMIVIPPREVLRNQISSPKAALAALGATHTLEGDFHQAGERLLAHAVVRDTRTQQVAREFSAAYAPGEVGFLAQALLETVTAGLKLEGVTIPETVHPKAYPDYAQGVHFLKDDAHLADRAIPYFERAASLDVKSALPYAGMAEAETLMFETSRDRQWLVRAEDALNKAVARNPDSVEVHLAAGRLKLSKNQLEEALSDFRRAVELEPSDADALRWLAMGYGQIGRTTEAVRAYQQAVSAQPDYYLPHQDLGVYFYNRGQYDEALTEFQTVTRLTPGIAQGHLNLGGTYGKLGQYPKSETEIREALRLRDDRDTWLALGAVLAYRKRFPESAEAYENAVEKGPATYLAMSNLGDAYRRSGRPSAAREAYKKALQIVDQELPQSPGSGAGPIRAFAGYLSARLLDRHRAKRETEDAIALSPGNTEVLRRAVLTYEVLGERDETIQILKTAPKSLLEDLGRQPDLADLQTNSRFRKLISLLR